MSLWVVRAGRYGEQQETALNEGVVCHAWNEIPDYSGLKTREQLRELYEKLRPQGTPMQIAGGVGQVWRFARDIRIGDLVALPLRSESSVAFGRVLGDYQYKQLAPNVMHIRRVEWLKTVPRSALPADILGSINAMQTVYKVNCAGAEDRIKRLLSSPTEPVSLENESKTPDVVEAETINIEQAARDEILKFIQSKFQRHDFATLVGAVLRAEGYKTVVSPPGPDGGVDILAGSGPFGFDRPRLCVQVKSGAGAEGQSTLNELMGVVAKYNSDQGLLVSWGGFTHAVKQDARKAFFSIRLWDQGDLVNSLLQNYEKLDEEIKAELPLKRQWILVKDDLE